MANDIAIVLFQIAWALAKAAAHITKHNMQPQPQAEPIIVLSAPTLPAPLLTLPPAANEQPALTQLELGDTLARKLMVIGGLMSAYRYATTPAIMYHNDQRAAQPYWIYLMPNSRDRVGPFSYS